MIQRPRIPRKLRSLERQHEALAAKHPKAVIALAGLAALYERLADRYRRTTPALGLPIDFGK